jgi:hypothetical protein
MKPDMRKVEAALRRYGKKKPESAWRELPPKPVVAQDAALRKSLKAHGVINYRGFGHPHFLNQD